MNHTDEHLDHLKEIRSIMERSTTFVSLTGLSGVLAGLLGLVAFVLIGYRLESVLLSDEVLAAVAGDQGLRLFVAAVAGGALAITLSVAFWLTLQKAAKRGQAVWTQVSRQFAVHLFVPLIAGGLFTFALAIYGHYEMICAALLIFYGLALLNTARFVKVDMFWLGVAELVLGIIASFWHSAGLILWAAGFGLATIIYGTYMYLKYER